MKCVSGLDGLTGELSPCGFAVAFIWPIWSLMSDNCLLIHHQASSLPLAPELANISLQAKYQKLLNRSQVQAVHGADNLAGNLSLVQGPPGIGKTKAIVSQLCEIRASNWSDSHHVMCPFQCGGP